MKPPKIEWYLNEYKCSRCGAGWVDEWSAMCNDRCPICDLEMTAVRSTDLCRGLEDGDYEYAARRLPSPLCPAAVADLIQAALEH